MASNCPGAHSSVQSVIVSVVDLSSTEFGPAMMSNSPGSTTRFISAFQKRNARSSSVKRTVRISPGASVTRSNAFSSFTCRVSDATFKAALALLGERGVVALIATCGYYDLVAMVLNVDRYPLPDGAPLPFPEPQ